MAFWNKKDYIDELIEYVNSKKCNAYDEINKKQIIDFLLGIKKDAETNFLKSEKLLVSFIYNLCQIMQNNSSHISDVIDEAKDAYTHIFTCAKEDEVDQLQDLFLTLFQENGIGTNNLFYKEVYSLFDNKQYFFEIMNLINDKQILSGNIDVIVKYIVDIKPYCLIEDSFKACIIEFLDNVPICSNVNKLSKDSLENVKKIAGVYSIDEKTLAKMDRKINGAESIYAKLVTLLDSLPEQIKLLDEILKTSSGKLENVGNAQVTMIKNEYSLCILQIKKEYQELWHLISNDATSKKDEIIREVFLKIEEQMKKLELIERNVTNQTSIELDRVRNEGSAAVERLNEFLKTNPQVVEALEGVKKDKEFMANIASLTEKFSSNTTSTPVIMPTIIIPEKTLPIPKTNYFFDDKIPFNEKIVEVQRRMKQNEKKGIIYHQMTETIIKFLIEKNCPYLYGPSGTGKTHSVALISDLLEVPFVDISFNEDYELIGYKNAITGEFIRTDFAECYEFGKIAFVDEMDNLNQKAVIKLNSFTRGAKYHFPGSDHDSIRHSNFRIIGAGNTAGNGANRAYNVRGKMDESVKQRFVEIPFYYDERIDKLILKDYPEWLDFIINFRKAVDNYSSESKMAAVGTITHSDVGDIKRYLDNNSFSLQEIFKYQFIQSKSEEYLQYIIQELKNHYSNSQSKAKKLCLSFIAAANESLENESDE